MAVRVQDIKYLGFGEVYDLHVPGYENYLAEGVVNHNTGKTRNVCEYIHLMASTYPGFRALITRKTRASLSETTLQVMEGEVMPEGCPAMSRGGDRIHRTKYKFPHGNKAAAEIIIGGCEEWGRIMGGEYDMVYADEATEFTREEITALRSRLSHTRGPFRQLVMSCNPSYPHHWLNQTAKEYTGGPMPEIVRVTSFLQDNAAMFDRQTGQWTPRGAAYIETSLKHLGGVFRRRMVESIWASSEGLVYEEFQPDIHSNATPPDDENLVHYGSGDYGWDHPTVLQCWGKSTDQNDVLYLRKEWTRRGVTNDLTFAKMVEYSQRYKFRIWLFDPAAKGFIEEAKQKTGLDIRGANNDVPNGIQLVKQRIKAKRLLLCADYIDGHDSSLAENGYPESLGQGFQSYQWKEGGKDEPEKKNDDQCFVAGTKIWTPNGTKNIEDIKSGDEIFSHLGVTRTLSHSIPTGRFELLTIYTSAGKITCTLGHPFLTSEGWNPAEQLKTGDRLCSNKSLMDALTASIRDENTSPATDGSCIGWYGSSTTARFQRDALSTTKILTRRITTSPTSRWSHGRNISEFMSSTIRQSSRSGDGRLSLLTEHLNHGMDRLKELSGIGSRPKTPVLAISGMVHINALSVVGRLSQERKTQGSVPTTVGQRNDVSMESTTNNGLAHAVNLSRLTAMQKRSIAPAHADFVSVLSVVPSQFDKVYNFASEDGTYLVGPDALIVSNCDACRYQVNHHDATKQFRWSMSEHDTIVSPPERKPQLRLVNGMPDDDDDDWGSPDSWWTRT